MAKGIRVNQLAKELGVDFRAILEKLKAEGIEGVANHMSTVSLGLAESIREWHAAGEIPSASSDAGGTAVETAVETKKKTARGRKKKVETADETSAPAVTTTETAVRAPETGEGSESTSTATPRTRTSRKTATSDTSVEPAAPAAPAPAAAAAAAAVAPAAAAAAAAAAVAPAAAAAAAAAAAVAPAAAATTAAATGATDKPKPAPAKVASPLERAAIVRETITLENRPGLKMPERKPVKPAPQLLVPKPAVLKGPQVVREEAPENLPAPRRRVPVEGSSAPGYTTARPTTGRGVRVSDDEEEERKKDKKGGAGLSARRRGPDGRRGEADEKLREFTEADRLEREERLRAAASYRTGFDTHLKKTSEKGTHIQAKPVAQRGEPVAVSEPITVRSLSGAIGIKATDIISKLVKQGVFATINQSLDRETAAAIALEYGLEIRFAVEKTREQQLQEELEVNAQKPIDLRPRPPVVTILGHVDHGKTSLLDRIRQANVAAGEAGGITQHTAAWTVTIGEGDAKKQVTFIDTPGHQAFTAMRARGASITDVVVLVVAAVEGVMPQTIESINHARAAEVPIVVAMSKIDRNEANPDMVLGQLAKEGLNPLEWGGDTEVIRTSATTGQGIKDLIETLDLQAQLLDLKADYGAPARGTVIEARIDPGLGPVATVLVQNGTLRTGDVMLAGPGYGRIRTLLDDFGKPINLATPSMPVMVAGLTQLPSAGDKFYVVNDIERARMMADERAAHSRQQTLAAQNRISTADQLLEATADKSKTINLIIKADVQGSIETLVKSVTGQNTDEVKVRVIHSGVGAISESDVQLAMATKAKPTDNKVAIIGFHVVPDESARQLAEQNHVDVKTYRVIYEIFDDLKKALSGMLEKEVREKLHGHADVRRVFKVSRLGNIAGCIVTDGHIQRGSRIRLIRDGKIIVENLSIDTLKRLKDDVKEVKNGLECGIKLNGYDDIKEGDRFEAYITEEFERTL